MLLEKLYGFINGIYLYNIYRVEQTVYTGRTIMEPLRKNWFTQILPTFWGL